MNTDPSTDTRSFARRIRTHALRMVHSARASHIGSCLSIADILAVLYSGWLRVDPAEPDGEKRDRFILSKGHAAAVLYAALAEASFFPTDLLETFSKNGSALEGHASVTVPGVELSTGSLGHGLPIGCGMAIAGKRADRPYRVCVLLSDGECDEGSVWEAALFARHHRLDNLLAIVDFNGIQAFGSVKDVLDLNPFADKWRAFGWKAREIDGHDHREIEEALLGVPFEKDVPSVILAHTVKGKNVSFMENRLEWHYKSPNEEQLREALAELESDS